MDHIKLNSTNHHTPSANEFENNQYEFTFHTFGCKVNSYDTGLIQKNLMSNGFVVSKFDVPSDVHKIQFHKTPVHVLNTCAVTAEATQQAVKLIRKIKSKEPLATVVVTGCAAQVDTGAFENLSGADLVVANSHKGLLPHIVDQYFKKQNLQKVFKSNIFKKEDLESGGGEDFLHTRSFLKIQDGCNSFCTFCIIPYARGKSRSISIHHLIQKIKELESKGVKEVVLTGVHIGDYEDLSYGKSKTLEDLIEGILGQTQIARIRLSSIEPIELTDRLLQLYQDERLCPHFHMSIQSADTEVLIQMKRKYNEIDVRTSLDKIQTQVKNAFIGMDVIAGFPTETDEQFENTFKVLSETPWTRLHVFPYSERQGTRAAILQQIPMMKRKDRARRLRELSLQRLQIEASKQIGSIKRVLVLNKSNTLNQSKSIQNVSAQGLSRDYWNVNINLTNEEHQLFKNTELRVQIEDFFVSDLDVILKAKRVDHE